MYSFFINVHEWSYIICSADKHIVNQHDEPTTPHKLATGTKTSVSNPRFLLYPCVVQKETSYVDTEVLNMRHQPPKYFHGISFGIPQHWKWYIIYILSTRKIVSSHDVVFDKKKCVLVYTSHPYSDSLALQP